MQRELRSGGRVVQESVTGFAIATVMRFVVNLDAPTNASVRGTQSTKRSEAHETLGPELAPHGVHRPLHIVGCVELVQ